MNRWWEDNADRLNREVQLMNQKFPQFQLGEASDTRVYHGWTVATEGQLFWLGKLKTNSGNTYTTVIKYPDRYPGLELQAYVIKPYIDKTNHRYGGGNLCLYSNNHGGNGQGTGKGMTAVSYVGWTAAWLHANEIYQVKGSWPENDFFNRIR